MKSNLITLAAITTCLVSGVSYMAAAQDEADALRYSYLSPQGTARSMGFGNALGSVGGDFTSLSVNPAGIGIYRSSDIFITPVLRFNGVNGNYLNSAMTDNNTRFNLNNIGVVFTRAERGRRYKNSDWKTVSFGVGVNRLADFNRDYTYRGLNSGSSSSSGSEVFLVDAINNPNNAFNVEGSPAFFGYQSGLLDTNASGQFYTNVPYTKGVYQQRSVKERGGVNELLFSLGGNYREKLMVGMTIGIPSIRYTRDATYTETDANNGSNIFGSYSYSESLSTTGLGINAKLGFIYKPADAFRIGVAIHTPTAYAMSDVQDQSLIANTEGYLNPDRKIIAPQNSFDYALTTPFRAIASGTVMLGKIGFFTADYEFVNYSGIRYRFRTDNPSLKDSYNAFQQAVNQNIKDAYKSASNLRAGVEFRLQPMSIRAGFGYYGSPYKNYSDANRMDFSAGLGFRFGEHSYLDLGYMHSQYQNPEKPYVLPTTGAYAGVVVPTATLKNNMNTVAVTLGFKF